MNTNDPNPDAVNPSTTTPPAESNPPTGYAPPAAPPTNPYPGSEAMPEVRPPSEVKAESRQAEQKVYAQRVEALRFERIKNLIGLVGTLGPIAGQLGGILGKFDISKLGAILPALQEFIGAESLKDRVLAGLKLARIYVSITPGDSDNALLDKIDQIIGNGSLLDTIVSLVSGLLGRVKPAADGVDVLSVDDVGSVMTGNHEKVFQAAGFDFAMIVTIVRMIVTLLEALKGLIPSAQAE